MVQFLIVCNKVFLILWIITEIESATNSEKSVYITKDEGVRGTFVKLLNTIANINEKRLNALKRYQALDRYNVASGTLRHADNEKEHKVAILLLNNNNPKITNGLVYKIYDNGRFETPRYTAVQNILQNMNEHYDNDFEESVIIRNDMREIEKLINSINNLKKQNDERETSSGEDYLRSWKSCSKKATKRCKKACKMAYKAVCSDYKCSKSMKKSFKKHCKSECKHKFQDD